MKNKILLQNSYFHGPPNQLGIRNPNLISIVLEDEDNQNDSNRLNSDNSDSTSAGKFYFFFFLQVLKTPCYNFMQLLNHLNYYSIY